MWATVPFWKLFPFKLPFCTLDTLDRVGFEQESPTTNFKVHKLCKQVYYLLCAGMLKKGFRLKFPNLWKLFLLSTLKQHEQQNWMNSTLSWRIVKNSMELKWASYCFRYSAFIRRKEPSTVVVIFCGRFKELKKSLWNIFFLLVSRYVPNFSPVYKRTLLRLQDEVK